MGFFNNFIKPKKVIEPTLFFSAFKNDIHSHLIPGIDDGSPNMDSTLNMLRKFQDLGFEKVFTTPHIMSDYYKNSAENILPLLRAVKKEKNKQGISVEIEAAAEYQFDDGFIEKVNKKEKLLTFSDNYLLIEFPFFSPPLNYTKIFFDLQVSGYKIILAHPERYNYWNKKTNPFQDLKNQGVYLQINLLSLINFYGPQAKMTAQYIVDNNLVDFVGSDCHKIDQLKILEENLLLPYFQKLMNSKSILNNSL